MLDPVQTLEDRVAELIDLLRQTVGERDQLKERLDAVEAELAERRAEAEQADSSEVEAAYEVQRRQALEVVESALAELGSDQSAA